MICTKCRSEKSADEFYKGQSKCKPCGNRAASEWKRSNPERHSLHTTKSYYKTKWGMSLEDRASMGTCCRICGTATPKGLAVDHDHGTGKIRGLLCLRCNTKLGWYEKYAGEIKDYLNASQKETRSAEAVRPGGCFLGGCLYNVVDAGDDSSRGGTTLYSYYPTLDGLFLWANSEGNGDCD